MPLLSPVLTSVCAACPLLSRRSLPALPTLSHTTSVVPFVRAAVAQMDEGLSKRLRPSGPGMLGDEMKVYEAETCAAAADMHRISIVRLDGHCFHTFTKGFSRPYDMRIHVAMVGTATDLLERFHAVTAYTESDEISLVFPPSSAESASLPFNGRVQKIASVFAGYASARFNAHMSVQPFDKADAGEAILAERVARSEAHFDARVFTLPSQRQLVDYFRWRALMDCRRNSISMLAQAHFPASRLQRVEAARVLRMLHDEKGISWEDEPAFFRFGCFVKKEQYEKPAFNPKTQQEVMARRTRTVSRAFEFQPENNVDFLLLRFWPTCKEQQPWRDPTADPGG
uniref:tRNAHis guanylyltransferase catalytic domain-containing protein n=1 Tax=Coccolithus braarudii TaxID=221442 RepID=A0A7S0LKQ3_9EUKA|mmetsp:Transcript_40821/g.87077  ORF Transcript_40821/g.87077 Transcript_40821/m.87077 type:complete len:341 (+) Transcript_40821:154-1176(+)|eukprot:CAMPEP_0183354524 /NCGR_PEP_ID=MMETSP0164_2-20130417/37363_1 /TAXON_ID=221442 /ORGANISM="Coccolithus pelagicus ssp braarudi, Strain PLY182g" /LENGTH=340 /DNA_ID=CAMNT_0025527423 /DNA_START=154 /DNA_END=1176 /DNA_ORIENTATION=-